ncbi:MAG: hypothetical protein Kow0075_17360 [Salibacteraceae bacterium]
MEKIILTGTVHTGKSTTLWKWISRCTEKGVSTIGILNPVIDGKKYFIDPATGERWKMEAGNDVKNAIKIGRYRFDETAFIKARKTLAKCCTQVSDVVVIDELGKLELNSSGLEPQAGKLLSKANAVAREAFIVVVRDYLLQAAISKFDLHGYEIVKSTHFD